MGAAWNQERWRKLERETARLALTRAQPDEQFACVVRPARCILQNYSTSFFIVTRFLPPEKRAQVEVIYAAVRYPDEIVDTFPLSPATCLGKLDEWADDYQRALTFSSLDECLRAGLNCFVAAFAQVVRRHSIPAVHYEAFLDAMRLDVVPRSYRDLEDLIESYIYGSATVVGYFLAYVYGPSAPDQFERTLMSSRHLGIALQLTNFLRDVREDKRRGRVYLPLDMLRAEGLQDIDPADLSSYGALDRVRRCLSAIAEQHYAAAEESIDAFAPDCRTAIQACIDVYRQLNLRIGRSEAGIRQRESVPLTTKLRVLPRSKYWRLPLAYLGGI